MKQIALALAATLIATTVQAQDGRAVFVDTSGKQIGMVSLQEAETGVLIRGEVAGLPAKTQVGFHIHQTGVCDPATGHDSAGGHFNPGDVEHGYLTTTGPHAGDMPNIGVDDAGIARIETFNPLVRLSEGDNSIMGRALMIHIDSDDYLSQPTGAAGARLACAVIE